MKLEVTELKELILWAKSHKIRSLKLGDVSFEISELAFVDSLPDISAPQPIDLSVPPMSNKLPDGNQQPTEDDELLYWSSRP